MSFALGQQKMRSYIIIIAGWQLGQGLLVMSHGALTEGLARSLIESGSFSNSLKFPIYS